MKRFKSFLVFLFALIFALPTIGFGSWFLLSQKEYEQIDMRPTTERAIAYVGKGNKDTLYTLHRAIEIANTGTEKNVYLKPEAGITEVMPLDVLEPLVIPTGVTLHIPYENELIENTANFGVTALADSSVANIKTNRRTHIRLYSTITIEAGATMNLGAAFSSFGITGKYSEITFMLPDSQIICNGTFTCYGYLKENLPTYDGSNTRLILNNNSVCTSVFGVYKNIGSANDFNYQIDNKIFPFNEYDFPNLQIRTVINYGASFKAQVHIQTSIAAAKNSKATLNVLAPSGASNVMFYMEPGNGLNYVALTHTKKPNGTPLSKIDFFSTITMGYVQINVGATVSSIDMFLPISHRVRFTVKTGFTFNVKYRLKFLGGNEFTVEEGATLNVESSVLFYDAASTALVNGYVAPSGDSKFILNGKLTIDPIKGFIGGKVHTTNMFGQAKIDLRNITSEKSLGATAPEGKGFDLIYLFLQGDIPDNGGQERKLAHFRKQTLISSSTQLNDCWDDSATKTILTKKIEVLSLPSPFEKSIFSYDLYVLFPGETDNKVKISDIFRKNKSAVFEFSLEYEFEIIFENIPMSSVEVNDSNGTVAYKKESYTMENGDYLFSITPSEAVVLSITNANSLTYKSNGDGTYTWTSYGSSGNGSPLHQVFESFDGTNFNPVNPPTNWPGEILFVKGNYFYLEITSSTLKYESEFIDFYEQKGSPLGDSTVPYTTPEIPYNVRPPRTPKTGAKYPNSPQTAIQPNSIYKYMVYVGEGVTNNCLTEDTLITMADGSFKQAGEVRAGDMLQVFNHETGELDIAPAVFNDDFDSEAKEHDVIYLEFSNSKTVKVVAEHGFFDLTTMQYEYIDQSNYMNFIGHRFVSISGDLVGETTLQNAYVKTETVKVVSPVTAFHLNLVTEDMLSMPGGIYGLFNMFEFDQNLQYNAAMKAADIEKYGLFTYEDFKDLVPYEFYAAFPAPYLKVAIGKGMITWEDVEYMINRYLAVANSQN